MDGMISDRVRMHGNVRLYNDGGNKVPFQKVERLAVDELVLDRFGAIEVALKMLGEPQPGFWLFTSEGSKMDIEISYKEKVLKHPTFPSVFLWRKKKSDSDHVSLVLTCRDDFTLRYPVMQFTASSIGSETSITIKEIYCEKELVDALEEILRNL